MKILIELFKFGNDLFTFAFEEALCKFYSDVLICYVYGTGA